MTIYLEGDFIVEADEVYREEGTVFSYAFGVDHPLDFTNYGRVEAFGNDTYAITTEGAPVTIRNVGAITAVGDYQASALFPWYSTSVEIINTGLISARADNLAFGVNSYPSGLRLSNSGKITAEGNTAYGVYLRQHEAFSNTGVILARGVERAVGVWAEATSTPFVNDGRITATAEGYCFGLLVTREENTPLDNANIVNTGVIEARIAITTFDDSFSPSPAVSDWILNKGRLIGDVQTGGGADTFQNKGSVVGDIYMGAGDDRVDLSRGSLDGTLYLGDGDDKAKLGDTGQIAWAGVGRDQVSGGRGDDLIQGEQGNDVLSGGAGNDEIYGGTGSDKLSGGDGDDLIDGFTGDEKITGGAGADTLTGGEGLDTFIYRALSDSAVDASDLITDLDDANDKINLSRIDGDTTVDGVQGFEIVDAFSGAAGELVLSYDAGTDITSLTVDVDGDGEADMLIRLSGDHESFDRFVFGGG